MPTHKSALTRSLFAFLLGLALTAVLGESGLRVATWYRAKSKPVVSGMSPQDIENPNLIRIIALGESTTMGRYILGRDTSWPAALERMLNASPQVQSTGMAVKILNIARSGTTTNFLVEELEEILPQTKPHFVISMMGINDGTTLIPNHNWFYKNSQLVRFAHWAWIDFRCPDCYRISQRHIDDTILENWKEVADRLAPLDLHITPKTETELDGLTKRFTDFADRNVESRNEFLVYWGAWLFAFVESPDAPTGIKQKAIYLAAKSFEEARPLVLQKKGSIKQACFVYDQLKSHKQCLDLIFESLQAGMPLTPDFLGLALSTGGSQDSRFKKIISAAGYKYLGHKDSLIGTRDSYNRLRKLSRQHGFHWFVMQYPTGSVGGLQALLATEEEAQTAGYHAFPEVFYLKPRPESELESSYRTLISNENFSHLAAGEMKAKYYEDLFAQGSGLSFGHTTDLGHQQIAQNAFEVVEPIVIEKARSLIRP